MYPKVANLNDMAILDRAVHGASASPNPAPPNPSNRVTCLR